MIKESANTFIEALGKGSRTEAKSMNPELQLMELLSKGELGAQEESLITTDGNSKNFLELLEKQTTKVENHIAQKDIAILSDEKPLPKSESLLSKNSDLKSLLTESTDLKNLIPKKQTFESGPVALKNLPSEVQTSALLNKNKEDKLKNLESENSNLLQFQKKKMSPNKLSVGKFVKEQGQLSNSLIKNTIEKLEKTKEFSDKKPAGIDSIVENMNSKTEFKFEAPTTAKPQALDLSSLNVTKSRVELIDKIADYIQQHAVTTDKSLDVNVHHDQLGKFKVLVQKDTANMNQMNLKISSGSEQALEFFRVNEGELLKSLDLAGIKVADFKISAGPNVALKSESSNNFNFNSEQSQHQQGQQKQQGDQNGSEKRKQLWEEYKERRAA